ncbi:MAG TPA: HAD-IIA family hydrolase [Homoserinimonas sp.]|nr:HAD-IIA family hydrolase [Homoserinimonas sp.]
MGLRRHRARHFRTRSPGCRVSRAKPTVDRSSENGSGGRRPSRPPAILCDIEGTLISGGSPLPGAFDAVAELRELGCPLRFLSNIDSRTEQEVISGLRAQQLDIRDGELFLPARAAVQFLSTQPQTAVLAVTSAAVRPVFEQFEKEGQPVTHVVVGDCRDRLSYALLDEAFRALETGARLLALQRSRYLIAADGHHLDTGAIVAALEYASGQTALVLGKPSPEFGALAAESFGTPPGGPIWVVGDDATTDIAMGNAIGATTVQVRTGKFNDQAVERAAHPADHQVDSIAELPAIIRRA